MNLPLFIGTVGVPELLIITFLVLIIFGAKRVPQLLGGLGKGIKEFKKGVQYGEDEDTSSNYDPDRKDFMK